MYLSYTNSEEIYNILKNLNARKSAGVDGIRAIDIKKNAHVLTPIMTELINSSLRESSIPELLKISIIRPIFKNGIKSDYNNYRPIAILSVVEKVLEEIVVRRLNEFLVKYKIINQKQYGFQKGKNINQLLGLFSNHVNQKLSKNKHCLTLFIDFSKAFDTLSHEKMLSTLERNGVRGHCLEWFKNYLQCRAFRVKIENNLSRITPTTHGVPQGSKLGPILYIIYANDLLSILKESTAYAYADDTAIIVSHESIHTATHIMQKELNNITRWCHDSGLIINAGKTKIMHIRPRHIPHTEVKITFHNTECLHRTQNRSQTDDTCSTYLEIVNTYKYLGVHLDNHFKWNLHIDSLQTKLRQSSYALYHLSNCAPDNVLRQAYFSLAESYLRHGITAWGTASKCTKLQLTQNRLLKILHKKQKHPINNLRRNNLNTNNHTDNNSQINNTNSHNNNGNSNYQQTSHNNTNLHKKLNILNIKGIYKTTIVNEFYDNPEFLERIDHNQNTRRRAEGRYKIPKFQNNYGKHSLAIRLPSILNQIPTNLLSLRNNINRKKLIKNYFLNS